MLRSARHWGRVRQERVLPAPQPQLFRRPQLPPRAHGPGPARRHRHTSQLFRTGQMAAASVRSVYRSNRYVRAQLSAQIDAAVQKGPRRIARFRARVPMARVKLQSAARHQDRAAGIDRQQGARRSAGFRRTGGNHSRSRGKENDVKERYEKPKITYGRAKAGAVLLSILLRSLSNKFGVWHLCHPTRSFDSAEDTWPPIHQRFRSKQSNLQLAPKQHQKRVKTVPPRVVDLNPHCRNKPSLSSRKCSASRPFAIVSKLFTLGIRLGTVWGPWGIGVHAAFLIDVATLAATRLCLFPDSLRSARLHNSMPSDARVGTVTHDIWGYGHGGHRRARGGGRGLLPVVAQQQRQLAGHDERGSIRRLQDGVRVRIEIQ